MKQDGTYIILLYLHNSMQGLLKWMQDILYEYITTVLP